jgi:hypothetical protein
MTRASSNVITIMLAIAIGGNVSFALLMIISPKGFVALQRVLLGLRGAHGRSYDSRMLGSGSAVFWWVFLA